MFQDLANTTPSPINEILEFEIVGGILLWHILSFIIGILLFILILVCCCVNFRIPRTKQEIEADYIRNKIARKFRKQLNEIPDNDMDEMDLIKAVEKVKQELMPKGDKIITVGVEKRTQVVERIPTAENIADGIMLEMEGNLNNTSTILDSSKERVHNSVALGNKFITLVNAFSVLRLKRNVKDSKQLTI